MRNTEKGGRENLPSFPNIEVGMVVSRKDFLDFAIHSVYRQVYPGGVELRVFKNLNKKRTIGYCFNKLVESCNTDWILFLGDDDAITRDYVFSLMLFLDTYKEKHTEKKVAAVTSNVTLIENKRRLGIDSAPTGLWNVEYLKKHPFNEKLDRWVDTDLFSRTMENEDIIIHCETQYGYYYRQHDDNISGNKWDVRGKLHAEILERISRNKEFGIGYAG